MLRKIPDIENYFSKYIVKILSLATDFAHSNNQRIFLVGGIVRDLVLGRPSYDIDIAVDGNIKAICDHLSNRNKLRYVSHERFNTATLFFGSFRLDFAGTRNEYYPKPGSLPTVEPATIMEDLGRRDFSVNAMAIELGLNRNRAMIIDPFNGIDDLKSKLIRILHSRSFIDDPTGFSELLGMKSVWVSDLKLLPKSSC